MKSQIFMRYIFYILLFLPNISFSQFDIEMPRGEKTEFSRYIFQSNYLTQNILIQFLDQSHELIAYNSKLLKLNAKDLYYEKSTEYKSDEKLAYWVHEKYLMSSQRKIEILDSALKISSKWKQAIIEDKLLDDILNTVFRGYNISIKGNAIYAVNPKSEKQSYQSMYKFEFDKRKRIISHKYGYLTESNDSLFWMTSVFEYKNKELYKRVDKKCNDQRCQSGYVIETKLYNEGLVMNSTKQTFSRNKNQLTFEETTSYFYKKNILDSTITSNYFVKDLPSELMNTRVDEYSKGQVVATKYNSLIASFHDTKGYSQEYKYDENKRLVFSEYESWDKDDNTKEKYTEKFEYEKNKYIYTYKESFKTNNGKEKLPLQYILTYIFI